MVIQIAQRLVGRQAHQMLALDFERPARREDLESHAPQDRNEWARNQGEHAVTFEKSCLPEQHDQQRHHGDYGGAGRNGVQCIPDLEEDRGRRLRRIGFIDHRIGAKTHGMRQLFHDQNEADGGQHAADHRRGKVRADDAGFEIPQQQLKNSRQDDGHEKCLEAPDMLDPLQHDDGEAGSRPGDAELRTTEQPDDDTAHDTRDETGKEGRSRCQGHPQTQRQGHQENDETGRDIVGQILQVVGKLFARHELLHADLNFGAILFNQPGWVIATRKPDIGPDPAAHYNLP